MAPKNVEVAAPNALENTVAWFSGLSPPPQRFDLKGEKDAKDADGVIPDCRRTISCTHGAFLFISGMVGKVFFWVFLG